MKHILIILATLFLFSCGNVAEKKQTKVEDTPEKEHGWENDSLSHEDSVYMDSLGQMNQAELNAASDEWVMSEKNDVEKCFAELLSLLPEYRDQLLAEKSAWKKYYESSLILANADGDHGSSSPMFINDVLKCSINLYGYSFCSLLSYLKHHESFPEKLKITDKMISDAYNVWYESRRMNQNSFYSSKEIADFLSALNNEKRCWCYWMSIRKSISNEMSGDVKKVYDVCTNFAKRMKLIQLKNQFEGFGVTSGEVLDCMLPENCTDKTLLAYPGFNVIWDKHLENLDWTPTFETE